VKERVMIKSILSLTCVTLLLAACGGGSDASAPPVATDVVPQSASQSVAGMTVYLGALSGTAPDDREPLGVASFSPPQPEDTEPDALK
jgi:hypothetical protein